MSVATSAQSPVSLLEMPASAIASLRHGPTTLAVRARRERRPPSPGAEHEGPTAGPRRVGDVMPEVLARYGLRMPAPRPR